MTTVWTSTATSLVEPSLLEELSLLLLVISLLELDREVEGSVLDVSEAELLDEGSHAASVSAEAQVTARRSCLIIFVKGIFLVS